MFRLNFYFEDTFKYKEREQGDDVLKEIFISKIVITKRVIVPILKGHSEEAIVLLTKELIEYSHIKRNLKELYSLVGQLEENFCFMKDEISKL